MQRQRRDDIEAAMAFIEGRPEPGRASKAARRRARRRQRAAETKALSAAEAAAQHADTADRSASECFRASGLSETAAIDPPRATIALPVAVAHDASRRGGTVNRFLAAGTSVSTVHRATPSDAACVFPRSGAASTPHKSKADRLAMEAAAASDTASLLRDDDVAEAVRLAGLPPSVICVERGCEASSAASGAGAAGAEVGFEAMHAQTSPIATVSGAGVRIVPVETALSAVRSVSQLAEMPEDAVVGSLGWLNAVDLAR